MGLPTVNKISQNGQNNEVVGYLNGLYPHFAGILYCWALVVKTLTTYHYCIYIGRIKLFKS